MKRPVKEIELIQNANGKIKSHYIRFFDLVEYYKAQPFSDGTKLQQFVPNLIKDNNEPNLNHLIGDGAFNLEDVYYVLLTVREGDYTELEQKYHARIEPPLYKSNIQLSLVGVNVPIKDFVLMLEEKRAYDSLPMNERSDKLPCCGIFDLAIWTHSIALLNHKNYPIAYVLDL